MQKVLDAIDDAVKKARTDYDNERTDQQVRKAKCDGNVNDFAREAKKEAQAESEAEADKTRYENKMEATDGELEDLSGQESRAKKSLKGVEAGCTATEKESKRLLDETEKTLKAVQAAKGKLGGSNLEKSDNQKAGQASEKLRELLDGIVRKFESDKSKYTNELQTVKANCEVQKTANKDAISVLQDQTTEEKSVLKKATTNMEKSRTEEDRARGAKESAIESSKNTDTDCKKNSDDFATLHEEYDQFFQMCKQGKQLINNYIKGTSLLEISAGKRQSKLLFTMHLRMMSPSDRVVLTLRDAARKYQDKSLNDIAGMVTNLVAQSPSQHRKKGVFDEITQVLNQHVVSLQEKKITDKTRYNKCKDKLAQSEHKFVDLLERFIEDRDDMTEANTDMENHAENAQDASECVADQAKKIQKSLSEFTETKSVFSQAKMDNEDTQRALNQVLSLFQGTERTGDANKGRTGDITKIIEDMHAETVTAHGSLTKSFADNKKTHEDETLQFNTEKTKCETEHENETRNKNRSNQKFSREKASMIALGEQLHFAHKQSREIGDECDRSDSVWKWEEDKAKDYDDATVTALHGDYDNRNNAMKSAFEKRTATIDQEIKDVEEAEKILRDAFADF